MTSWEDATAAARLGQAFLPCSPALLRGHTLSIPSPGREGKLLSRSSSFPAQPASSAVQMGCKYLQEHLAGQTPLCLINMNYPCNLRSQPGGCQPGCLKRALPTLLSRSKECCAHLGGCVEPSLATCLHPVENYPWLGSFCLPFPLLGRMVSSYSAA